MLARIAWWCLLLGWGLAGAAAEPTSGPVGPGTAAGGGGGAGAGDPSGNRVSWALGARARQSSTRTGCAASFAVDGVRDGDRRSGNVALTRRETNPFWEVDLGEVRAIDEVRLHLCRVGCGEGLRDVVVLVATEPFRHRDAAASALQLGVKLAIVWGPLGDLREDGKREAFQTIRLTAAGRWVRVQRIGAGVLGLAEVELLGPAATGAPAREEPQPTHPPDEP